MIVFVTITTLASLLNFMIVLMFRGSIDRNGVEYWEAGYELQHIITYIFIGSIAIPLFLIVSACIFQWSFAPLKILINKIQNKK